MKRLVAGALTVLAVVGGLAAAGPARASSSAWYQTLQVNRSGTFSDIAAISKTNIWAVGDLFGKKDRTIYQPFIRHFDGSGWKAVTIPGSPRFASDLVSASARNNVWVIGLNSAGTSVAYRYDGSHWHKIRVPAETFLQGAVALGPRNVWAFGDSGTLFAPHCSVSADVFHWNGSKWRGYCLAGGNVMGESISASATNNVWIAGALLTVSSEQAVAYRWNGTHWHKADAGIPRAHTTAAVSAISRSNVWIGWNSRVAHWNGRHWRILTTPFYADPTNVVPDGKGGYWFGFAAIRTGNRWRQEPEIAITGGLGPVVRIPGTESFLLPATVKVSNTSTIQKPTLYRFNL